MAEKSADWRPGHNVCRCCFAEGCYKDISNEYFWMGKREVYSEMLSETFDVSISYSKSVGPNSNSRLICEPCISRIRDASDFKRQVLECEKMFIQQLDPGSSGSPIAISVEPLADKEEVKLERVKLEQKTSDDEFDDHFNMADDDDEDLDIPLTKLATKVPKKESVDLLDLLDNARAEKRKSTTKAKPSPAKKVKKKEIIIKATGSKTAPKPAAKAEKKKEYGSYVAARKNAEIIVKYTTAYPFRLPEDTMVCTYCGESFEEPALFRKHNQTEHHTFNIKVAFMHCHEGDLKVDCTDLRCRICTASYTDLQAIAHHLKKDHMKKLDVANDLGLQPFKLENNSYVCAICGWKCWGLRLLSRHTQTHFLRYTCEACGKSFSTVSNLKHHIRFSHSGHERICRKCRKPFATLEEKREHVISSPRCWPYLCSLCGQRSMTWTKKQEHLIEVHNAPKKVYSCTECPEVFMNRAKYRSHFKVSHTNDNFQCSCCGLKFDTKKYLEEHIVVHTKEKLFPCTFCSKSFSRKKNLAQHLWIHSEHKRFSCATCNKVFNQRVSWRTHMKSYHPEFNIAEVKPGKNDNSIKFLLSLMKKDE